MMTAKKKKITLKQVAELVGVSAATVSYAFSRPDQLSAERREEILAACKKLGYTGPNRAAQSLRKGKSGIVALVLADKLDYMLSDPVANEFVRGVGDVLESNEHSLLLFPGSSNSIYSVEHFVDGFICYGAPHNSGLKQELTLCPKPIVTSDFAIANCPSVQIDNFQAAKEVTQQVLTPATRTIVILGLRLIEAEKVCEVQSEPLLPAEGSIARQRLEGYLEAVREVPELADASVQVWSLPESSADYAQIALNKILNQQPAPDLFLCMSDVIALAAARKLLSRGLKIPQDVQVVGFDGIGEMERFRPALTTVQQFSYQKGRRAAEALLNGGNEDIQLGYRIVQGAE